MIKKIVMVLGIIQSVLCNSSEFINIKDATQIVPFIGSLIACRTNYFDYGRSIIFQKPNGIKFFYVYVKNNNQLSPIITKHGKHSYISLKKIISNNNLRVRKVTNEEIENLRSFLNKGTITLAYHSPKEAKNILIESQKLYNDSFSNS
jgi:hypothetical protein